MLSSLLPLWLAVSSATAADVVLVSEMTTVHTATPGQSVRGELSVRNTGTSSETVTLSLHDFATRAPTTRDLTPPGSHDRSLFGWIDLDSDTVRVDPGEVQQIRYTIAVPEAPPPQGSYWSVLMIEEAPEPLATQGDVGLLQRSRIASRVVVDVSGGSRLVSFVASGLEQSDETVALYTDIENVGTSMLRITPKVELYRDDGSRQGAYQSPAVSLYPGSTWRYAVPLPDVPTGEYTAIVVADGGDGALFGARHPVRIE